MLTPQEGYPTPPSQSTKQKLLVELLCLAAAVAVIGLCLLMFDDLSAGFIITLVTVILVAYRLFTWVTKGFGRIT